MEMQSSMAFPSTGFQLISNQPSMRGFVNPRKIIPEQQQRLQPTEKYQPLSISRPCSVSKIGNGHARFIIHYYSLLFIIIHYYSLS